MNQHATKLFSVFVPVALGLTLLVFILSLLALPTPLVYAATLTVNTTVDENDHSCADDDCSLRDAIEVAAAGDTIEFDLTYPATITLTLGQLEINKSLTINGPGAENVAISGNNSSRVFEISGGSTVIISDITIRDGIDNADGGGINIRNANLTLNHATIVSNSAYAGGGIAIFFSDDTILNEVEIIQNLGVGAGGGIYVGQEGKAILTGGQVISNSVATGYGGGIAVDPTAIFTQTGISTITRNSAFYGGGVFVNGSIAVLNNGQIISNSAQQSGGGVFIQQNGMMTLNGGNIISNTAYNGGGIYIDTMGNLVQSVVSTISHNLAWANGGGLYVKGNVNLKKGRVISNYATWGGGGVFVTEGGNAVFSETHIIGNDSVDSGGLLLAYPDSITVTNSCIVNNSDTAVVGMGVTVTITNTWWGAANGPYGAGPGSGDSVNENVVYEPFISEAPVGCPTRPPRFKIYLPVLIKNN